jgi:hypothetical protein
MGDAAEPNRRWWAHRRLVSRRQVPALAGPGRDFAVPLCPPMPSPHVASLARSLHRAARIAFQRVARLDGAIEFRYLDRP